MSHSEDQLQDSQIKEADLLLEQVLQHVPLAYLFHHWEFFGLDFYIDSSVLIPRPETELLVEVALKWIKNKPVTPSIVDVGTGSGCISIALATHFPKISLLATDVSRPALQIAQKNVIKFRLCDRISLIQTNLLDSFNAKFSLILANLPYIPSQIMSSLPFSQYEPLIALNGGEDGAMLIKKLIEESTILLDQPGLLLLEIESSQGQVVLELAQEYYPNCFIEIISDLNGHPRLLFVENK